MNTVDRKSLQLPLFAGLDVGSLSSKALVMNRNGIVSYSLVATGAQPRVAAEEALKRALAGAGGSRGDVRCMVGTGYGRVNLPMADRTVTELTCHARGAHYLNPEVRTVIDIGGQDSKVIHVDHEGNMIDFAMNDKCAAGTGRFLEVMTKALEMTPEDLGKSALLARMPCSITNTCAVFAESEVISLLASGETKVDIAAGLLRAVAQRVGNMARRLGVLSSVAFVGGVAKNAGVRKALEEFLDIRFVSTTLDPQLNGALGAAVLAREACCGKSVAESLASVRVEMNQRDAGMTGR